MNPEISIISSQKAYSNGLPIDVSGIVLNSPASSEIKDAGWLLQVGTDEVFAQDQAYVRRTRSRRYKDRKTKKGIEEAIELVLADVLFEERRGTTFESAPSFPEAQYLAFRESCPPVETDFPSEEIFLLRTLGLCGWSVFMERQIYQLEATAYSFSVGSAGEMIRKTVSVKDVSKEGGVKPNDYLNILDKLVELSGIAPGQKLRTKQWIPETPPRKPFTPLTDKDFPATPAFSMEELKEPKFLSSLPDMVAETQKALP